MNKENSITLQISIFYLFIFILLNIFVLFQFKASYLIELVLIDILLILFYIFLLKKLKVLTIQKEKELINSRNLFLRNIMHELKTPITKGKIVTNSFDDTKKRTVLSSVFNRLEFLLNEFSKIEELTSGFIKLEIKSYRAVDLIDESLDMLLLNSSNSNINLKINKDLKIDVDFKLFSSALKNLIDNAIKYNTNDKIEIIVDKNSIEIKNKGKKLKKDINTYYKAFNRDYEKSNDVLGLGLFISNSIINLHNYKLEYKFKDNYHLFQIVF